MPAEIVVADDEDSIRQLLRFELENAGYESTVFVDGRTCWEHLQSSPPPDVVLLDVMMPAMDGTQVLRKIRASDRLEDLPVVLLTSRGQETDIVAGFESGATDYITKPFKPKELILRINRLLD